MQLARGLFQFLLTTCSIAVTIANPDAIQTCPSSSNDNCRGDRLHPYKDTCQYYLAPSSIPNAGFGIYTVDPIPSDSPLTQTADAPSIIVTDVVLHSEDEDQLVWNHVNYFWDGAGSGEHEAKIVEESVVTFGSLCNYHTYLLNVKPHTSDYQDDLTPRESGSPGMGAYSYHKGYLFQSQRDIEAGEEIFCDYGEEWLDGRPNLDFVARGGDYAKAAEIINKFASEVESSGAGGYNLAGGVVRAVKGVVNILDERVSSVLPDNEQDFVSMMEKASEAIRNENDDDDDEIETTMLTTIEMEMAKRTLIPRTMDWILSEGKCLDNLLPQVSTLPHAGQGAFAQRFIPKGTSIVPLVLLHIMDYRSMEIHEFYVDENGDPIRERGVVYGDDDDDDFGGKGEAPRSLQLMVNYCFSHQYTTMYMCPQTNGILMNHCSNRTGMEHGGDCARYNSNADPIQQGANAKLVWATDFDPDTETWLNMTVDEIEAAVLDGKRGLTLDAIATRDIYPGDEVFIDYGASWEEEWAQHVKDFVPPQIEDYGSISILNENIKQLRTPEELEKEPYPSNAKLTCAYWIGDYEEVDDDSDLESDTIDWGNGDGSIYTKDNENYPYSFSLTCHVLERNDSDGTYTVELIGNINQARTIWLETDKRRILHHYPRESIKFEPEQYTSDQHLREGFRFHMGIPDELFAEKWKNVEYA